MASSPVVGTFAAAKDRSGRSPAPAAMQRMPSSRARQNSTQNIIQSSRNRSSSTNHKNGNSMHDTTADIEKVSSLTGRTASDVKNTMKETVNSKGEHLIEDISAGDGTVDLRGGILVGTRTQERALKLEGSVNGNSNGNSRTRPPSISTRGGGGGNNSKQASKTVTPITTSFSESVQQQRPRPQRGEAPIKRSHKKGAGLAAQLAAAAAAKVTDHNDENSSPDDDEEEVTENEPRYCYCHGISYGEMVGCDGKECQREWFHLSCVGLEKAPGKNGKYFLEVLILSGLYMTCVTVLTILFALVKWYCDECKGNIKDKKFNGSAR